MVASDLHGTGMADLLYSRAADGSGQAQLRFLDFTGGHKPYLLDTMDNHLGARTTVQYRTVTLHRQPESIAFTSPINATGLFDLEPESGLLLPFEGMGVDTVWRLELPKAANPFDYRSIADVLLTVKYTALDNPEYRQRVVRDLDRRFSDDRSFSLRNQFPDAWYELSNPDTVDDPERRMRAVLPLSREDFPPHIQDLAVAQLSLFVVRKDELADELTLSSLSHASDRQTVTAGEVRTTGGIVSTRRPAGTPWRVLLGRNPVGDWEIRMVDDALVRSWFRDGLIEDVILVLTLSGDHASVAIARVMTHPEDRLLTVCPVTGRQPCPALAIREAGGVKRSP